MRGTILIKFAGGNDHEERSREETVSYRTAVPAGGGTEKLFRKMPEGNLYGAGGG